MDNTELLFATSVSGGIMYGGYKMWNAICAKTEDEKVSFPLGSGAKENESDVAVNVPIKAAAFGRWQVNSEERNGCEGNPVPEGGKSGDSDHTWTDKKDKGPIAGGKVCVASRNQPGNGESYDTLVCPKGWFYWAENKNTCAMACESDKARLDHVVKKAKAKNLISCSSVDGRKFDEACYPVANPFLMRAKLGTELTAIIAATALAPIVIGLYRM